MMKNCLLTVEQMTMADDIRVAGSITADQLMETAGKGGGHKNHETLAVVLGFGFVWSGQQFSLLTKRYANYPWLH